MLAAINIFIINWCWSKFAFICHPKILIKWMNVFNRGWAVALRCIAYNSWSAVKFPRRLIFMIQNIVVKTSKQWKSLLTRHLSYGLSQATVILSDCYLKRLVFTIVGKAFTSRTPRSNTWYHDNDERTVGNANDDGDDDNDGNWYRGDCISWLQQTCAHHTMRVIVTIRVTSPRSRRR